jgi:hypothetical protein
MTHALYRIIQDEILDGSDGPATEFVQLCRALDIAQRGYALDNFNVRHPAEPEDIANAMYQLVEGGY